MTALKAQMNELAGKRAELQQLQAQEQAARSSGGEVDEALLQQVTAAEKQAADLTDRYGEALVTFINSDPPVEGEPLTPMQQDAIHMKVAEDVLVAREYIEKGGDYRRAIEIYNQIIALDPDNAEVEAELAKAQEMRFMTPERFAQVTNGMSQDEVRAVLGPVNAFNIREYEDRGVLAWLYPREDGAAAGVYFNKKGSDPSYVVYQTDFDAVKRPEAEQPSEAVQPPEAEQP
jgi:tetratricopeptide (TPR) repeat protein